MGSVRGGGLRHSNAATPSRVSGNPAARNHSQLPPMLPVASSVSTNARSRARWAVVSAWAPS